MTLLLERPTVSEFPVVTTRRQEAIRLLPPETSSAKIMIVDDEPVNIKVARKYLSLAGYSEFVIATDPTEVLTLLGRGPPDLLLLDIMMPGLSGLELLANLRADKRFAPLPVLILTAMDDSETKAQALNLGATDFLTKPVDPTELIPRVRNAIVLKAHHDHLRNYASRLEHEVRVRTEELEASRQQIIDCLARAAEFRDNDTGRHIVRVGRFVGVIARELGLEESVIGLLEQAARLHDVGKIGVPDAILLKPGKLDPEEMEVMQKHCGFGKRIFEGMTSNEYSAYRAHTTLGSQIVENCRAPLLDLAARIALTHHEKWDGSGYPLGLAGENIPLEGRITAVADVFDALSSKRPYKPAFPLEKCLSIMEEGRGKHFDPTVLEAFFKRHDEIVQIQLELADLE